MSCSYLQSGQGREILKYPSRQGGECVAMQVSCFWDLGVKGKGEKRSTDDHVRYTAQFSPWRYVDNYDEWP